MTLFRKTPLAVAILASLPAAAWCQQYTGYGDPTAADTGHRFYTGLAAQAAIDRLTSIFFEIEFLPFTDIYGFTPRKAYEGTYNQDLVGTADHGVYFTGGLSLKF